MRAPPFRALGLALLAGCASPEPAYYTLAAVPGTVVAAAAPRTVELRRVGLAGYLDRPELVRTAAGSRLRVLTGDRWGEPLGPLVGRVLAEDLLTRLPGSTVFTETGAVTGDADVLVEIEVNRFDADPAGTVVLLAQVSVRPRGTRAATAARSVRLTRPAGGTTGDLVATMGLLLGDLGDVVAGMVGGVRG